MMCVLQHIKKQTMNQIATTPAPDAHEQLAKMDAAEAAAAKKLAELTEQNEVTRKVLREQLRVTDLADVLRKIEFHGFTATDLRSVLKTKGARKTAPRKSAVRKTTRRKAS